MEIKKLQLENFRNYANFTLDFNEKILLIKGKNTLGKTNLIGALFALSIGKSFRLSDLSESIEWEKDYLRIKGFLANEDEIELFCSRYPRKQKIGRINGVGKKLNNFVGHFLSVLFTPEDIDLISAAPGNRRRFLDISLSQISQKYLFGLLTYQKILKQRNKLLKAILEKKSQKNELDFWDSQLCQYGEVIFTERMKFFQSTKDFLAEQYCKISGKEDCLELHYLAKTKNFEEYTAKLKEHHDRDILLGETSIGPHRDDFSFILKGKPVTSFGSRGEYRSCILALKLGEVQFIEKETGQKPVLLLDDVFSELDSERQKYLLQAIINQQTIISTTDNTILETERNLQILELS